MTTLLFQLKNNADDVTLRRKQLSTQIMISIRVFIPFPHLLHCIAKTLGLLHLSKMGKSHVSFQLMK